MGIWAEDGTTVWLPRDLYPSRNQAKLFAVEHCEAVYIDVRVRARHMAISPGVDWMVDDWWVECERDTPGAMPVWRVE